MTERTRTRAPWIVWGIVVTLLLVTLALAFRNGSVSGDALTIAVSVVMMVGYLTTGAVVAALLPIPMLLAVFPTGRVP